MPTFQQIPSTEPISGVIKAAFDTDLPVEGGWGYAQENATVILSLPNGLPATQFEHMLASMRAYLEMNMTLPKEERYGSINPNEKARESIQAGDNTYDKVTYEISAMQESRYTAFIDEYKKGYGKEDFDMEDHFRRRKEATLIRIEEYWFDTTHLAIR